MTYLDTGYLVKLYYPEIDSGKVINLVQGKEMAFTPLHELEFVNALESKAFFKSATPAQVAAARQLVAMDLRTGVLRSASADWKSIFAEAVKLSGHHTGMLGCRSLDVLHCAAAKLLGASEFISTDARQKKLAAAIGLNLISV